LDTKWKNRWVLLVWLLLFSHGVNGIMLGLQRGQEYINKDYFQSNQFENQLNSFIDSLSMFELHYIPKEEALQLITVTDEDINEHRYRYGNLQQQIENLKAQYEGKIQDALAAKSQQIADTYTAERDQKIADITKNFQSDEYVRVKVVKEKEQKINHYYQEIEQQRRDFLKSKGMFLYVLKNSDTGKVYSNVSMAAGKSDAQLINAKDQAFIRTYPSPIYGYLSTEGRSGSLDHLIPARKAATFEGQIAIPKSAIPALSDYQEFENRQSVFYIFTLTGIGTFLISMYLWKQIPVLQLIAPEKVQPYYYRIPIDIRIFVLVCSSLITLLMLVRDHPFYLYLSEYNYDYFSELLFEIVFSAFFVGFTMMQGKYSVERFKDTSNVIVDVKKSIIYRIYMGIKDIFLIQRIGIQMLILLSIVFLFGAGLVLSFMHPALFACYVIGWAVLGLPLLILIFKRTGYFNQIVLHTTQLAHGNLEPDLPVRGRSVFATLATNINVIKHGVKVSRKEQAKSERLKTELITNVSHDLRTPLTSVITYTELLKTPYLSDEERNAYIEIIDRKSKRLKVLIDDLFEVSKMASGNVQLTKEKVDLVQLLQQSLAEYNEQIDQSTLQFRVTTPDTPVYAHVDGQKIWRVFDNLIGNILKYSLENTRVYISVQIILNQVVMTFKNVAKYELGENVDGLLERFKRGDESRHTEGSGLGLAIANSIIDLHEGNFKMEADGDLFKVTVALNTR